MFFNAWVAFPENELMNELKSELSEMEDDLDELEDQYEEIQDELDELDIDVSLEPVMDSAEQIFDTIKDLAFSPTEIAGFLPMMNRLANAVEEIEESGYYGGQWREVEDMLRTLEEIKVVFVIFAVFLALAIGLDILYILLHILNKKGVGGGAITLHILWTVAVSGFVLIINFAAQDEFGMDMFTMTPAPFIGVGAVVVSAIIWSSAKKDYAMIGGKGAQIPAAAPVAPMPVAEPKTGAAVVKCSHCGKESEEGALFCNGCGTKLEQPQAKCFCTNCGHQVDASAMFCPNCGNKIQS